MKKNRIRNGDSSKWINVLGIVLIVLAALALVSIIFYVIFPYLKKDVDLKVLPDATANALILSCVTLSITLSIVVPWMMSKTQIHTIAEDSVKKYYDRDFKQAIQKTHNTLFRAYANDSRMIAYFLCKEKKPIWALGWVCKSSISYDNVHDSNQINTYSALAVSNIFVLINCVLIILEKFKSGLCFEDIINADNDEKKNEVATRTTRDLVKFCSTIELRDKDYANIFEDKKGKDIPETLNLALNDLLMCLVSYLSNYHSLSQLTLWDRIELDNIDEEYSQVHQDYYYAIEKKCNRKKIEDLLEKFESDAEKLKKMFDAYLLHK